MARNMLITKNNKCQKQGRRMLNLREKKLLPGDGNEPGLRYMHSISSWELYADIPTQPQPAPAASTLVVNRRNPPARSPTPPSRVIKSTYGGNLFTSEDVLYLKKYIDYCQEQGLVLRSVKCHSYISTILTWTLVCVRSVNALR